MRNKLKSLILPVGTAIYVSTWTIYICLMKYNKSFITGIDEEGVIMTLFYMFLMLSSFICPFIGLYLWYSANFRIKSKYFVIQILALTPWLLIGLNQIYKLIFSSLAYHIDDFLLKYL